MIEAYLTGKLKSPKLKEFEQTLYAYILPDDLVLITSFDFENAGATSLKEKLKLIEAGLRKQDFFFIGQLKRREYKAQQKLYDRLYPKVKKHILKNSGDQDDALDLTQEVIVRLYQKLREEDVRINTVDGFAFGILRNLWLKELEKRKRNNEAKTAYGIQQETQTEIGSSLDTDAEARARILRECMKALKPDQHDFLEYYDLEGHSARETALHFEMDEASVRVKANRCRKYLRKKLIEHPEYDKYF